MRHARPTRPTGAFPPPRRGRARRVARALALLALLGAALTGCGRHEFTSTPPGATIEFSRTGTEPWLPLAAEADGRPRTTPFRAADPVGGFAFVRATLPGHLPSDRQLIDFSRWRVRGLTLKFELRRTEEDAARERLASGLVPYAGDWVRPDDLGLVERAGEWVTAAEAERRDREAAGFVEWGGEWMTAEEAAGRRRAELLARGYVEHRGRLVAPEEAERFEAIDAQVARLAAAPDDVVSDNALLEATGATKEGLRVRLFNATSLDVEVLLSGATTASVPLGAYEEKSLDASPGEVAFAVLPVTPGVFRRFLRTFALEDTTTYTFTYLGLELGRDLDAELAAVGEAMERPTLEIPEVRLPEGYDPETEKSNGTPGGGGGGRRSGGGGGARRGR